jgi:hypothetical protein
MSTLYIVAKHYIYTVKRSSQSSMTPEQTRLFKIAERRCAQLGVDVSSVLDGIIVGSYYGKPLNVVEYCLHEVSHLVTFGYSTDDFPKVKDLYNGSLTEQIGHRFNQLSKPVSDALEIDTSIVTYEAGKVLGLWNDHNKILNSCLKNLSLDMLPSESRVHVQSLFDQQAYPQNQYNMRARQGAQVARWFVGRSKL